MKFRVHTFQVQRVPYEVDAESQKQAAELVHADGGVKLIPCSEPESAEEWQSDSIVDPLLPNGEVDYENSRTIDLRSAPDMRKEALELLEKAQGIDGLKPFVVMHEHAYGTSGYMCWSNSEDPSRDEASSVLDSEFEEDRNETLSIQSIDLNELTGVAPSSHGVDPKKEHEKVVKIANEKESFAFLRNLADQSYSGKVMGLTELHVVLSLGRTALIITQADIDKVPSMNDDVVVKFAGSKGVVEFVKGKEVDQGR